MPTILSQDPNGRWTIKNIRHTSLQGVKIPATFTYNGIAVSFEIESTPKTVVTDWYTTPGEAGRLDIENMVNGVFPRVDDVDRVYTPVTYGGYSYKVMNESFSVTTYSGSDTGDTGVTYYLNVTDFVGFEYNTNLTRNIEVSTNVPSWTPSVVTGSSWLSVQKVSGGIKITATANTGAERDGRIKIVADGGEVSTKYISVTQAKKPSEQTPYIELSIPNYGSQYTIDSEGGTIELSVQSNTGWTLSKSNNVSWATITSNGTTVVTGGTNNRVLFVTIGEYAGTSQNRSVTISGITNGANSVYDTVKITQLKQSDTCTQEGTPCDCDGNDTCSSECVPYSPCDTAPCDCTCDGNEACSDCTCNTVDVDDSESATVDNSPISVYCEGDYTGNTRGVTATDSDTHWIATPVNPSTYTTVDWVGVSPSAGTGNASIEISVLEDNTGKTIRNCFVWVRVPDNHSGAHGEVSVTQYPTPRFSVPSQSQVVVQHEGSTGENIFVNTNYGVTATTDADWITLDQEEVANGVNVKVVVNTTPSAERTGNVTISSTYDGNCASFESVTVSVKQLYNPPIDPEGDAIYIHESATSTDSSRRLELNCNAAAQDLHIWIENSGDARVVENDGNLEVTDTGGNPFHNGETILPTGLGNRRELIVKIPKNTNTSTGRTFEVKFKIFWTEVDSLGRHTAILEVTQARNNIWYDNYSMTVLFDGMQPGETAHTFTSDSHVFSSNGANDKSEKPRVVVTAYKHDTSGTYTGELTTIEDYIESVASMSGVNSKMSISAPYWMEVVHDGNYEDMQYPATVLNPYALSFGANTGYDTTGDARVGTVTVTYNGTAPNLVSTISVTQPYAHVEPPDLGLYFYKWDTQAWTGTTITLTPNGANNEITFEILGPSDVQAKLAFSSTQNALSSLMNLPYNGLTENDLYNGVDFPAAGTQGRIFTFSTKGGQFDLTITCMSTQDDRIKTILTAHVNAV